VSALRVRLAVIGASLALLSGCGSGGHSSSSASTSTSAATSRTTSTTTADVKIAPSEQPACALLFARLQRVTVALQTSAELIAHSTNKQQLSKRIGIERVQLERSAKLMTGGPIPASLRATDRELVGALRGFSAAFARAGAPAARGDFQAASAAMGDAPDVQRILATSKTIEDACH
jgi:hypothetical protein